MAPSPGLRPWPSAATVRRNQDICKTQYKSWWEEGWEILRDTNHPRFKETAEEWLERELFPAGHSNYSKSPFHVPEDTHRTQAPPVSIFQDNRVPPVSVFQDTQVPPLQDPTGSNNARHQERRPAGTGQMVANTQTYALVTGTSAGNLDTQNTAPNANTRGRPAAGQIDYSYPARGGRGGRGSTRGTANRGGRIGHPVPSAPKQFDFQCHRHIFPVDLPPPPQLTELRGQVHRKWFLRDIDLVRYPYPGKKDPIKGLENASMHDQEAQEEATQLLEHQKVLKTCHEYHSNFMVCCNCRIRGWTCDHDFTGPGCFNCRDIGTECVWEQHDQDPQAYDSEAVCNRQQCRKHHAYHDDIARAVLGLPDDAAVPRTKFFKWPSLPIKRPQADESDGGPRELGDKELPPTKCLVPDSQGNPVGGWKHPAVYQTFAPDIFKRFSTQILAAEEETKRAMRPGASEIRAANEAYSRRGLPQLPPTQNRPTPSPAPSQPGPAPPLSVAEKQADLKKRLEAMSLKAPQD